MPLEARGDLGSIGRSVPVKWAELLVELVPAARRVDDDHLGIFVGQVEERVRQSGRHERKAAALEHALLFADSHLEAAGEDMERLFLRVVDVQRRAAVWRRLDDYGILVTLVGEPGRRQRMSRLRDQRMLTPSGITRAVARLEERGLVGREPDPADGRAFFATLTPKGVKELRRAQHAHHAIVRELYLRRLDDRELAQLAKLFEKAVPGVVSSAEWPPTPPR